MLFPFQVCTLYALNCSNYTEDFYIFFILESIEVIYKNWLIHSNFIFLTCSIRTRYYIYSHLNLINHLNMSFWDCSIEIEICFVQQKYLVKEWRECACERTWHGRATLVALLSLKQFSFSHFFFFSFFGFFILLQLLLFPIEYKCPSNACKKFLPRRRF